MERVLEWFRKISRATADQLSEDMVVGLFLAYRETQPGAEPLTKNRICKTQNTGFYQQDGCVVFLLFLLRKKKKNGSGRVHQKIRVKACANWRCAHSPIGSTGSLDRLGTKGTMLASNTQSKAKHPGISNQAHHGRGEQTDKTSKG